MLVPDEMSAWRMGERSVPDTAMSTTADGRVGCRTARGSSLAWPSTLSAEAFVADLEALHLSPPIAAAVSQPGLDRRRPVMRDAAPTAARGHNLVALLPPVPAAATPALAGTAEPARRRPPRRSCSAADGELDEWARPAPRCSRRTSGLHIHVARSAGRAARRLRGGPGVDLLVCSPRDRARAARPLGAAARSGSRRWCWPGPESGTTHDGIAALMQDLPKEAQRIVLGSSPRSAARMVGALRAAGARR